MNNINKTLYIPLYGKAYVNKKGIILKDQKAEEIWEKEKFILKRKSRSKYLAYYMAMRSYVFDQWLLSHIKEDSIILHIGCGMDARVERIPCINQWYDIDLKEVIRERRKYFQDNDYYHMMIGDIQDCRWLNNIPKGNVIVLMEGMSMYVTMSTLKEFFCKVIEYFDNVHILVDCYSGFAANASKYKNPIQDVGVKQVYGIDNPKDLEISDLKFIKEHNITPLEKIRELKGIEKMIFKYLYAGHVSHRMYRLYEYKTNA